MQSIMLFLSFLTQSVSSMQVRRLRAASEHFFG